MNDKLNIDTNQVISLLQSHRSIRKFTEEQITEEVLGDIIASAQMASTSSHVQAYSILGVKDPLKKKKLAELAGNQPYVESCAHFLVFCADLHRLEQVSHHHGVEAGEALDYTELFMVATIDAALAAQNAAVAAESYGLGIVYIGGLRNQPEQVSQLLELPPRVYPVFGMCIGYPDQQPEPKPRLPQASIYFEDAYPAFAEVEEHLRQYDQRMKQYYLDRTGANRQDTWSEMMANMLKNPRRTHIKSFLEKQGFPLK